MHQLFFEHGLGGLQSRDIFLLLDVCICVRVWGSAREDKQLRGSLELGARVRSARHSLSAFLRLKRLKGVLEMEGAMMGRSSVLGQFHHLFLSFLPSPGGAWFTKPLLMVFHSFYLALHFWRANSYESVPLSRNPSLTWKKRWRNPQLQQPSVPREYLLPLWISLPKNTIL